MQRVNILTDTQTDAYGHIQLDSYPQRYSVKQTCKQLTYRDIQFDRQRYSGLQKGTETDTRKTTDTYRDN